MSGPPTTTVTVSGAGFGTYEAVDIYFGTTDEALASTSGTGNFAGIAVQVPASAVPGTAYLTAVGRHSGVSARAQFSVSTSWAQYRYSGKHDGSNPYENVLSASNVSGIDMVWSFPTGSAVSSSPAVADGVVYIGSQDYNVHALNAATGAKVWSFPTGAPVDASPAVADGVVYIGSQDHNVYALSAATGAKVWSFPTGAFVESSPAVADGVVYIGSGDGNVYALNAATGAKVWSFNTGVVIAGPAVANGVVYAGQPQNVYALNAATGAKVWSFTIFTPYPLVSSPAVADGVVYIGSGDGNVYALSAATGAKVWSFPASPPGAPSCPRRRWRTGWSTSARATTTCTLSAPPPGPRSGASPPGAPSSPRRRWRTGWSTSARATTTCTLSAPPPGPRSGASPPGAPSSPRRRWRTGRSTSARATATFTRSALPAGSQPSGDRPPDSFTRITHCDRTMASNPDRGPRSWLSRSPRRMPRLSGRGPGPRMSSACWRWWYD